MCGHIVGCRLGCSHDQALGALGSKFLVDREVRSWISRRPSDSTVPRLARPVFRLSNCSRSAVWPVWGESGADLAKPRGVPRCVPQRHLAIWDYFVSASIRARTTRAGDDVSQSVRMSPRTRLHTCPNCVHAQGRLPGPPRFGFLSSVTRAQSRTCFFSSNTLPMPVPVGCRFFQYCPKRRAISGYTLMGDGITRRQRLEGGQLKYVDVDGPTHVPLTCPSGRDNAANAWSWRAPSTRRKASVGGSDLPDGISLDRNEGRQQARSCAITPQPSNPPRYPSAGGSSFAPPEPHPPIFWQIHNPQTTSKSLLYSSPHICARSRPLSTCSISLFLSVKV